MIPTVYDTFFRAVIYEDSNSLTECCNNLLTTGAEFCYILHDKDIESFENGEPVYKKPHYHFCIFYNKAKSNKLVMNALHMPMVFVGVPIGQTKDTLLRYLVHLDEPLNVEIPKTRYPFENIHSSSDAIVKLVTNALYSPTKFDEDSSKTEDESLFDDLHLYYLREIDLRELLIRHPRYMRYFPSLSQIYFTIYHCSISDIPNYNN